MYKLNENSVQRLSDNASIPLEAGNRDYQELQAAADAKQLLMDETNTQSPS